MPGKLEAEVSTNRPQRFLSRSSDVPPQPPSARLLCRTIQIAYCCCLYTEYVSDCALFDQVCVITINRRSLTLAECDKTGTKVRRSSRTGACLLFGAFQRDCNAQLGAPGAHLSPLRHSAGLCVVRAQENVSGALRKQTAAETRRMYKGMNQAAAQHLLSSMYPPPYDGMGLYEQAKPSLMYRVPRVVPDQKARFETDELFRRLSRESEVKYVGFRDRPLEERQMRFAAGCQEGHTEIAIVATGTNFQLVFTPGVRGFSADPNRECDFDKEPGKVHIKSRFILNGVCTRWRGWIDLDRLDGVGCVEFDEEAARIEDEYRREQVERFNQRLREFEEEQRAYRNLHGLPPIERPPGDTDLANARKKMEAVGHAQH